MACGRPFRPSAGRVGARPGWCRPSTRSRRTPTASSSFPARPAGRAEATMQAALVATAIVVIALLWETCVPFVERRLTHLKARRKARADGVPAYDPGRERRAEQRARELLRTCVNEEEWEMYRDLGFL